MVSWEGGGGRVKAKRVCGCLEWSEDEAKESSGNCVARNRSEGQKCRGVMHAQDKRQVRAWGRIIRAKRLENTIVQEGRGGCKQ